jgi:hypothetical protein
MSSIDDKVKELSGFITEVKNYYNRSNLNVIDHRTGEEVKVTRKGENPFLRITKNWFSDFYKDIKTNFLKRKAPLLRTKVLRAILVLTPIANQFAYPYFTAKTLKGYAEVAREQYGGYSLPIELGTKNITLRNVVDLANQQVYQKKGDLNDCTFYPKATYDLTHAYLDAIGKKAWLDDLRILASGNSFNQDSASHIWLEIRESKKNKDDITISKEWVPYEASYPIPKSHDLEAIKNYSKRTRDQRSGLNLLGPTNNPHFISHNGIDFETQEEAYLVIGGYVAVTLGHYNLLKNE